MKLTESHNLSGDIRDAGGVQKVMLRAGYSARTFSLTVETLDNGYVADHRAEVQAETETFIREAIWRASGEIAALPTASGAE